MRKFICFIYLALFTIINCTNKKSEILNIANAVQTETVTNQEDSLKLVYLKENNFIFPSEMKRKEVFSKIKYI